MEQRDDDYGDKLTERLLNFVVRVIKLVKALPQTDIGEHVRGQLLRSGTSPDSNYEEARGAESFVESLLKECEEIDAIIAKSIFTARKNK
ncbi:MAG: four helix bundle protein [Nitrospinota bacterium]|jgi:hypothetical protein|nr:four helix bundle protein [Nitrospinota bacterium]|tara:strand:+ start:175 stop:444 length:270 start_codon:yes stop_codon:yes gene_type:complete